MMDKNDKTIKAGIGVLVINKQGEILLGKRKSKHGRDTYALPGGHLEFGESFEECAKRELKEETNLDGFNFKFVSPSNRISYGKHYVTIRLMTKNYSGELEIAEPDKCESWN